MLAFKWKVQATILRSGFSMLTTVEDVIDALGGNASVMELTKSKSLQTVTNWRYGQRIAAHTYVVMTTALKDKGLEADPSLWGITPAEPALS